MGWTKEKAGKGNEPPLVVEEIPEDDNRATIAVNKPPSKNTKPLEVEEIPEDDNRVASNTGGSSNQPPGNHSSDKPKKEKSLKTLTSRAFGIGLAKSRARRSGIPSSEAPAILVAQPAGEQPAAEQETPATEQATGDGSNPGGSGGEQSQPSTASDISGEYASRFSNSERTIIYSMTVTRAGANEWRGVIRLVSEDITPCSSASSSDLGQNSSGCGRITRDGAQYAIVFRYSGTAGVFRPAGFSTSDGRPVAFDGGNLNWSESIPGNSKFYRR